MGRQATGTIVRRDTNRGRVWALKVSHRGERYSVRLGGDWEGWSEARAAEERDHVARLISRGEWVPPTRNVPATASNVGAADSFAIVASVWLDARSKRLTSEKSIADLRWRLGVAVQHIGQWPISEITEATIDDMVTSLLTERAEIEKAAAAGKPLTEPYVDPRTGRTHTRRRRGLSNGSINKVLGAVRQVLADAKRRRIITSVVVDADAKVTASKPSRSFLQVRQAADMLAAARALEDTGRALTPTEVTAIRRSREPGTHLAAKYGVSDSLIGRVRRSDIYRPGRRQADVARRAPLAVLLGAGLRVGELCALQALDVNMRAGLIVVRRDATKTDAGERTIPMLPLVRRALEQHLAEHPAAGMDLVFRTSRGTPQNPDNVRTRLLAPVLRRANADGAGVGHCTPHTMRRTFASLLAELDVPPRRAMYLLGHTDAKFTMSVYQQVLDLGADGMLGIENLVGCGTSEAREVLSGRGPVRGDSVPESSLTRMPVR
jgi:integrase